MLVLTVKEQYVLEILSGTKKIEYRSWPTSHRGEILLHCSKKDAKRFGGLIVAKVEILGCKYNRKEDDFEWELGKVTELKEKPQARGKLRLWSYEYNCN